MILKHVCTEKEIIWEWMRKDEFNSVHLDIPNQNAIVCSGYSYADNGPECAVISYEQILADNGIITKYVNCDANLFHDIIKSIEDTFFKKSTIPNGSKKHVESLVKKYGLESVISSVIECVDNPNFKNDLISLRKKWAKNETLKF